TDLTYARDGERDILYAGLPSLGTYLSTDGGETWANVHAYVQMRRVMVGVDPKNWKDIVDMSVYNDGSFEGVSRSTDGGGTWQNKSSGLFNIFGSNNQGWYDAYVHRDPNDPDRILAGGISVWLTQDGGDSWQDVGLAYNGGIHPDQHYAEFSSGANPLLY